MLSCKHWTKIEPNRTLIKWILMHKYSSRTPKTKCHQKLRRHKLGEINYLKRREREENRWRTLEWGELQNLRVLLISLNQNLRPVGWAAEGSSRWLPLNPLLRCLNKTEFQLQCNSHSSINLRLKIWVWVNHSNLLLSNNLHTSNFNPLNNHSLNLLHCSNMLLLQLLPNKTGSSFVPHQATILQLASPQAFLSTILNPIMGRNLNPRCLNLSQHRLLPKRKTINICKNCNKKCWRKRHWRSKKNRWRYWKREKSWKRIWIITPLGKVELEHLLEILMGT